MSTSPEFVTYLCEQLEGTGEVRSRKMFGEYMVYLNDRPVLLVCDDTPFVKMLPCVEAVSYTHLNYDRDLPYCFNRKEAKDHGEGGSMVGYKPQDGDDVAIIEDVVTAGTAVRESIELFKHVAKVNMKALFVSVDRMERGTRDLSLIHI